MIFLKKLLWLYGREAAQARVMLAKMLLLL